jgi:hypothetical protein
MSCSLKHRIVSYGSASLASVGRLQLSGEKWRTHVADGKQREAREEAEPEENVAGEGVFLDGRQPADRNKRDLGHLEGKEVEPDGRTADEAGRAQVASVTIQLRPRLCVRRTAVSSKRRA